MNDHARIIALERRGYSRRQAQFLCLVLLHSGCFLRRQYGAFSRIEDGACTTDFVQGLVRRRLAICERFDRYAQLIRLSSGLLYEAIGEPHSRLQRGADPALVTQRLMTLDVLIRYRDHPCLATAEEKRRFFTEVFGVAPRDLPSRTYHSPNPGVPPTTQYFVDRIPILLGGDTTAFVYAAGWAPLGHFAQFLNTYTPLMRAIRRARVLFGATDDGLITRAARMCRRRFGQAVVNEPDAATREQVLAHFAARRRFELRQFRSFTEPEREQLRRDLDRYKGDYYERWYAQWCLDGAPLPPPPPTDRTSADTPFSVQFVPVLLPDRYPFVAPVKEAA